MIFKQLNEKMRAMDRSLLEKVAADIEMLDDDQGNFCSFYTFKAPLHLAENVAAGEILTKETIEKRKIPLQRKV